MSASLLPTDSDTLIPGRLSDALIEAVVLPQDRRARAAVICALVHEMCTAVEWLRDSQTGPRRVATGDELVSLRQIAAAAEEHCERMARRGGQVPPH